MGGDDGGDAAEASLEGARLQAEGQREALDYLKEKERIPSWYSDQANNQLAGFYGLQQAPSQQSTNQPEFIQNPAYYTGQSQSGLAHPSLTDYRGLDEYTAAKDLYNQMITLGVGSGQQIDPNQDQWIKNPNYIPQSAQQQAPGQQQFIEDVKNDYFYRGMVDQGEEAIYRNAAMTGGLRSGNANEALAQNSQNVLQELTDERLSGLRGFTGSSGYESQIANTMSGIGQTMGQGEVAAGQAYAQGAQNQSSNLMSGIGTGLSTYGALTAGAAPLMAAGPAGWTALGVGALSTLF